MGCGEQRRGALDGCARGSLHKGSGQEGTWAWERAGNLASKPGVLETTPPQGALFLSFFSLVRPEEEPFFQFSQEWHPGWQLVCSQDQGA